MGHIMQNRHPYILVTFLCTLLALCIAGPAQTPSTSPTILSRDQTAAILPATVFFRGQAASIQGRNTAGLRLPDGKLVLFAMVDTTGYSSAIQQKYQAYLITEVPLQIADHTLAPGAYGFGYIANDQMVLMDVGGNDLLHTSTLRDTSLARPTPLQLLPADPPGRYLLYLGRDYLTLAPAK